MPCCPQRAQYGEQCLRGVQKETAMASQQSYRNNFRVAIRKHGNDRVFHTPNKAIDLLSQP